MNDGNQDPGVSVVVTDTLNDKVVIVISSLTGCSSIFTAFDVTKQIRRESISTQRIAHHEVKKMVLELFNSDFSNEYDRECIDLTVGQRAAFVYYPKGESPYSHPLAVQIDDGTDNSTDNDADTDLTVENRLNIGKSFLVELNLTAGKLVAVTMDNKVMFLMATTDPSGTTLVVNADGRLRINKKMLTKQFGYLPTKFDISYSASFDAIEVAAK